MSLVGREESSKLAHSLFSGNKKRASEDRSSVGAKTVPEQNRRLNRPQETGGDARLRSQETRPWSKDDGVVEEREKLCV